MRAKISGIVVTCLFSFLFQLVNSSALIAQGGARLKEEDEEVAEGKPDSKELNIGDWMPDVKFAMMNYRSDNAYYSDFRGKYVILDFWATWCTSCINKFPKLDSIQAAFGDKLQILLVNTNLTNDKKEKIAGFFSKWENDHGEKLVLPSVINDTLLYQLFQHKMLPHYVWIDNLGFVKAITASSELTKENIDKFISGEAFSVRGKHDFMSYDRNEPLFQKGNGGDSRNQIYRSMMTGYLDGIPQGVSRKIDTNQLITRYCITNYSIIQLIKETYRMFQPRNRILLEVKDTLKYIERYDQDGWAYSNTYCYELITPPTDVQAVYAKARVELSAQFEFSAGLQKRNVNCWVLVRSPKNSSGTVSPKKQDNNSNSNITIPELVVNLNNVLPIPVLDESNYSEAININITPEDLKDIKKIKFQLNMNGFDLVEMRRFVDMFVISDLPK